MPSLVGVVGEATVKEKGDRLLAAAAAFSQELKLLGKSAAIVTMDETESETLGFIGCNGIGVAAGALLLARYLEMKAHPMAEVVYSHVVVSGSGEIQ